jgi:hypothetical protein
VLAHRSRAKPLANAAAQAVFAHQAGHPLLTGRAASYQRGVCRVP